MGGDVRRAAEDGRGPGTSPQNAFSNGRALEQWRCISAAAQQGAGFAHFLLRILFFLFQQVTCCSMHWDAKRDTRCSIAWENDKLNVIVTVYAMAIDAGDAGPGANDDGY